MTIRRKMIGSSTAQAREEWSWPSSFPTHHQGEREDGSTQAYNTQPFHHISQLSSAENSHAQPVNLDFFNCQQPFDVTMDYNEYVNGWMSRFSQPDFHPFLDNDLQLQHSLPMQVPNNGFGISWEIQPLPPVDMPPMHPEHQDAFGSDCVEPRGSASSVAFSSATPQTATSSMSDGWVFPVSSPPYGSPGGHGSREGLDLNQPVDDLVNQVPTFEQNFMPCAKASSPISSDDLSFDEVVSHIDWNLVETFGSDTVQWSPSQPIAHSQAHQPIPHDSFDQQRLPWATQETQPEAFHDNTQRSCVPFSSPPEFQYHGYGSQIEAMPDAPTKLPAELPSTQAKRAQGIEWEELRVASYAASSSSHSRSPPVSQNTPPSQSSSSSQNSPSPRHKTRPHTHIFRAKPTPKRKSHRGRVGPLTNAEKRNARDVRMAGACWACHLSKIRCSPCYPGAPCEQCTRLAGKRRFCLMPCFNDPLEALNTFLVPEYLMGHFNKANVNDFVDRNALAWGTERFVVHMSWGFKSPLRADVVTLTISPFSEIGYRHRAIKDGYGGPTISRHASPPIGVPLGKTEEMEGEYAAYVKDIVMNDLDYYAEEAYADEASELPEMLLRAVCTLYTAGLDADEECDLLRQAIEIHVTCTILERSLILDNDSLRMVEASTGQKFPARSAPRCAQRQIKLALYNQQRERIINVLGKWGPLMWAVNTGYTHEHKWVIGFSVFLMLTLVIDKTLGAAYFFCESKIKNQGVEAEAERARFAQLTRLTETMLFERCKEIMHSRFKTRKAGKESCNPIRDGNGAWKGVPVDVRTDRFVEDLQAVVGEFRVEIRAHRSIRSKDSSEGCRYMDAGQLARRLLDDFLG